MPNFQNPAGFDRIKNPVFDQIYPPGTATPLSGIYRCEGCGFEAVSTEGHPLPPTQSCQDHHHMWPNAPAFVRWRLVAVAIHAKASR